MNRTLMLACLLLATASARADLVTIVASGSLTNFSDSQGLLPFSQADAQGGFTFTVVYDDTATADLVADPARAVYSTAVQSMQLTVGAVVVPPWSQKGILIFNDRSSDGGLTSSDLWGAQTLQTTAPDQDGNTRQESFDLTLVRRNSGAAGPPLTSDALVQPPWPYGWSVASIRYRIDDYDAQHALLGTPASAEASAQSLSITTSEVPLPAAGWLLGTGLLAVASRRRRRA